jgi:hypothetical protein
MSKLETPLIRKYWKKVGGTLVEEFPLVFRGKNHERRLVDAIIIPKGENKIVYWREISIENKEIIAIQAKAKRLGMYLMGQAFFTKKLLEKYHKPKKVISVALCTKDDDILRLLLEKYSGMKVIIN